MGVSKNKGTPKWMVYNGKLIKMDHLGEPLFLETPIYPPQICLFRIMVLEQRPNDPRRPSLSLWMFGPQWMGHKPPNMDIGAMTKEIEFTSYQLPVTSIEPTFQSEPLSFSVSKKHNSTPVPL